MTTTTLSARRPQGRIGGVLQYSDDSRVLAEHLGLDTAAEVLAVTEQVLAPRPDRLTPKVRFHVEELFAGPAAPSDPT